MDDMAFNEWVARQVFVVVEDMTSSRLLVSGILRSLGAGRVVGAGDGGEALAKLTESGESPTVFICDWVMPGMDGLALLDHAKKRFPNARFVMLTAKIGPDDVKVARDHGVDGYVGKPFSRETLVGGLKKVMAKG